MKSKKFTTNFNKIILQDSRQLDKYTEFKIQIDKYQTCEIQQLMKNYNFINKKCAN